MSIATRIYGGSMYEQWEVTVDAGSFVDCAHELDVGHDEPGRLVVATPDRATPLVVTSVSATTMRITNLTAGALSAKFLLDILHSGANADLDHLWAGAVDGGGGGGGSDVSNRRVVDGLFAIDPTTPSVQASGAALPEWRVNVLAGHAICGVNTDPAVIAVEGIPKSIAVTATPNYVVTNNGNPLPSVAEGEEVYVTLVVNKNGLQAFAGQVAAVAAATQIADADIDTAIGADGVWVHLGALLWQRTGDVTFTQVQFTYRRDW